MKTIEEIRILSNLKRRQTVYYRIKKSGIEEKTGYKAEYKEVNGKIMRCFPEDEALLLISMEKNKHQKRAEK